MAAALSCPVSLTLRFDSPQDYFFRDKKYYCPDATYSRNARSFLPRRIYLLALRPRDLSRSYPSLLAIRGFAVVLSFSWKL